MNLFELKNVQHVGILDLVHIHYRKLIRIEIKYFQYFNIVENSNIAETWAWIFHSTCRFATSSPWGELEAAREWEKGYYLMQDHSPGWHEVECNDLKQKSTHHA